VRQQGRSRLRLRDALARAQRIQRGAQPGRGEVVVAGDQIDARECQVDDGDAHRVRTEGVDGDAPRLGVVLAGARHVAGIACDQSEVLPRDEGRAAGRAGHLLARGHRLLQQLLRALELVGLAGEQSEPRLRLALQLEVVGAGDRQQAFVVFLRLVRPIAVAGRPRETADRSDRLGMLRRQPLLLDHPGLLAARARELRFVTDQREISEPEQRQRDVRMGIAVARPP